MTGYNSLNDFQAAFDQILGHPPHVTADLMPALAPLLSRDSTRRMIDLALNDRTALATIASRSYTHALGFGKITLLEPTLDLANSKKGLGYQLRLHIWQPGITNGVSLVESKHEHSFDFVSRVLTGEMENQCYTIAALLADEQAILERLLTHLQTLQTADRSEASKLIEALEAIQWSTDFGSQQAASLTTKFDRQRLLQLLALNDEELTKVVRFQGRYQYDTATSVFGGEYVHRLKEVLKLTPHGLLKLRAGDLYHHGHMYAHRLFIEAGKANSTIIITTPSSQEAKGGSFQHPTWFAGENVNYARQMYTVDELSSMLTAYRKELDAAPPSAGPERFFDVAKHGQS